KYRATSAGAPNFGYELCMRKVSEKDIELLDLSSWQIAFNGAEPVRPDTLTRFAEKFASVGFSPDAYLPCYGLAEATLIVSGDKTASTYQSLKVEGEAFRSHQIVPQQDGQVELIGSGQVCEPDSVKIVQPTTGSLAAPNQIGEVWVKGPHVAKGYWNNEEDTARTFGAYLRDTGAGPFMRTGDLGFLHEGELFITGRAKDLIIIRGKNHYPQDIELTAERSHTDLQLGGSAAFSIDHEGEEKVVLVQEVKKGALQKVDPKEIFQAIRQAITTDHQVPLHAIVLVKRRSLRKTSSGKIQRHANKLAFERGELKVEAAWYQPGETQNKSISQPNVAIHLNKEALSRWVVEWLSQKLSIAPEKIDLGDPLSAYGIDSLMLAEFEVEISDFLGKQWPVRDLLLTEPSIEELAERGMEFVKEAV
ncbi:MAG: non-ribosomal peptide synthetase, partial [Bacteroidota bacterium]